jgi:hypothetical protein
MSVSSAKKQKIGGAHVDGVVLDLLDGGDAG